MYHWKKKFENFEKKLISLPNGYTERVRIKLSFP